MISHIRDILHQFRAITPVGGYGHMVNWQLEARRILRAELARRDWTYARLVSALGKIGVEESVRSVTNKLSRGTYSFAFFLQCMKAMGRANVEIDLRPIVTDAPESPAGPASTGQVGGGPRSG